MASFGFSLTVMSVSILIMLCFFTLLLRDLFCKKSKDASQLLFLQKYGSIVFVSFSLLTGVIDFGHTLSSIPDTVFIDESDFTFTKTISDICYFSSVILLYILFIHRIYASFLHTMYEVSKRFLTFLIFWISIYIIFILIYILFVATNQDLGVWYYVSFMFIELIISISILYQFILKLREIILNQIDADLYQYVTEENEFEFENSIDADEIELGSMDQDKIYDNAPKTHNNRNKNESIQLDQQQISLITLITKISILSILAIVSVQIFYISVLIGEARCHKHCDYEMVYPLLYCIRSVAVTINVIVLYLNFDFNSTMYAQLCKWWHMKCYRLCAKLIKKAIKQQHANLNDYSAGNYQRL